MLKLLGSLCRCCVLALAFSLSLISKETTTLEKQVEMYLKGLKYVSSEFVQTSNVEDIYTGTFWMEKNENGTFVRITYETGIMQDIFINDKNVAIIDNKSKKEYRYSISQTPIYPILTGDIDFAKEKFKIIENSNKLIRLKLTKSSSFGGMTVTLVFSKYEASKNLKNLIAWIIDDGKTETLFSFDEDTLSVNDKNKIPKGIFDR